MKTPFKFALSALLGASLMFQPAVLASPAEAEIDGVRIGRSLEGSLFQLRLIESGLATAGTLLKIRFDVQANVDYALVTGRDRYIADIDLYVYHENGSLIIEDTTTQSRGAVRWRSQYTGTASAYVHVKRTTTLHPGSYAAFLGVLEIQRVGPAVNPSAAPANQTN